MEKLTVKDARKFIKTAKKVNLFVSLNGGKSHIAVPVPKSSVINLLDGHNEDEIVDVFAQGNNVWIG